jgi:hypothetical protein
MNEPITPLLQPFTIAVYSDVGEVLMTCTVQNEDDAARACELMRETDDTVAGWLPDPPPGLHRVEAGAFVAMPARPSYVHVFDWTGSKEWIDPRTLDDLRAAAWERLKKARADALASGVDVEGLGRFDSDEAASTKLAAVLAGLPYLPIDWTVTWTRFDNSAVELDKMGFSQVAMAVLAHGDAVHQTGRDLRAQLAAAETPAAVAAVAWPGTPLSPVVSI